MRTARTGPSSPRRSGSGAVGRLGRCSMSQTASAEWRNVLDEMTRVRGAVRRHGVGRTVRRLASAVGRLAYLHQSVVWYRLDLPARGDRIPLPRGISVIRATEHDLHL